MKPKGKENPVKRPVAVLGIVLLLAGVCLFAWVHRKSTGGSAAGYGAIDGSILVQIPAEELPAGALYITEERRQYARGQMVLIVPSIGVSTAVGESTLPEGLEEMPGLYEFSQMPGAGDVNVSIAGHRDIFDKVFLDLDKISVGAYAYLLHEDMVYRYIYKDSRIVKPSAWEAIKPQGFSCLTLTTCDPVGTTINRLITRFEFTDCVAFSGEYQFIGSEV